METKTLIALKNLAYEMRFLLRQNPKMDGGLYRLRLTEAENVINEIEKRIENDE